MRKTPESSTEFSITLKEPYSNSSTIYYLLSSHLNDNRQKYLEISQGNIITANDYCLVVKIFFPDNIWGKQPLLGSYLAFGLSRNIFKMYIMITDIASKKGIDLIYLIKNFNSDKEAAVVSVFSDNIRYEFTEPRTLELEESRSKRITAGPYMR